MAALMPHTSSGLCPTRQRRPVAVPGAQPRARRARVTARADFGRAERKAVLDSFYHKPSRQSLEAIMADDFTMKEDGGTKTYTKQDYIGLLCDCVLPAVPDFNWGAATNGETDDDGYAIVTVSATGHHTGASLKLPGLEPIPSSGRHFCLAEEVQKVKVKGDKIEEIQVLPNKGAGPRALYVALGGTLPVDAAPVGAPPLP